jgi:hypothetical protein
MTGKARQAKFSRAERFLVDLATSMPGPTAARSTDDVETAARGIADYFVRKVATGDMDAILEVFDGTLRRDTGPAGQRARTRRAGIARSRFETRAENHSATGVDKVDPHYWG